jgi:hypothetical protein
MDTNDLLRTAPTSHSAYCRASLHSRSNVLSVLLPSNIVLLIPASIAGLKEVGEIQYCKFLSNEKWQYARGRR